MKLKDHFVMEEVVWLDSAVNDLVRLKTFIANDNPNAAKRAVRIIYKNINRLLECPFIGKPVENLNQFRDLFIRFGAAGYIIRYRITGKIIYIVYLKHYRELDFQK